MYDHDIPRAQIDRLDKLIDLMIEVRDRLPQPPPAPPGDQVLLKEPATVRRPESAAFQLEPREPAPARPERTAAGKPPPRSGPRSGRDVWVSYARSNGLTSDGMTRDEIIDALRQSNVPVD